MIQSEKDWILRRQDFKPISTLFPYRLLFGHRKTKLTEQWDIKNQRRVHFVSTSVYINISYNSLILTGVLVQVGSAIAVNLALLLSVYNLTHVCINLYQISSTTLVRSSIIRNNGPLQSNFP